MANKLILIIIAVVVLAAALVALFFFEGGTTKPGGNNYTIVGGGGSGQSYMSQAEMQALFGQGTYVSTAAANASSLAESLSKNSTSNSATAFLHSNVTAYWQAEYNITGAKISVSGTAIQPLVVEEVFETPKPQFIYSELFNQSHTSFDITNATSGSMTFSYAQQDITLNGTTFFLGYKGNEVTILYVIGKAVNITALTRTVAGDMP